jgi:NhaA family Na+:H+ antiporter
MVHRKTKERIETEEPTRQDIFLPGLWFFKRFFKTEASSSILLSFSTLIALLWANSLFSNSYQELWHVPVSFSIGKYHVTKTFHHWINDGLMTIFFFTVGLEIKREVLVGALASRKKALLPLIAALGGILVPGIIYAVFNSGLETMSGWAVPTATDIAFALGAIALFGDKLPVGLKVFLTALAIADDLGAVFIIALFYTKEIVWPLLSLCLIFTLALSILNFLWVSWTPVYGLLGLGIWLSVLGSGIHPTVAGILVALFIPAKARYDTGLFIQKVDQIMQGFKREGRSQKDSMLLGRNHLNAVHALEMACHHVETPLQQLEHGLHPWVSFGILPLFALANAGLTLGELDLIASLTHPVTMGIALGLIIGKPAGITLFAYISVRTGLASLPEKVTWNHIWGVGMLGGIGFTMSLFVSNLSFSGQTLMDISKFGILIGSVASAFAGITFLTCVTYGRKKRSGSGSL